MLRSGVVPGKARRLLLIAYFYPPEPSSGARRPAAIAKHLAEHGWEVDVVCRRPDAPTPTGALIAVPFRPWTERVRGRAGGASATVSGVPAVSAHPALRSTALAFATYPDRAFGWLRPVTGVLRDHLRVRPPDAILSTSPPETAHLLAKWAKQRARCPWIADLRDPWSDTHLSDHPRWRQALDRWTERHVLAPADALVTVSEPIASSLRKIHGDERVVAIRNGYDPDEFPATPVPVDRRRLAFTYAGGLYPQNDLGMFLEGSRAFLDQTPGASVTLRILGEIPAALAAQIDRHGLRASTTIEPRRPHADAVAAMRESPVLLFLPWQDAAHPGVYSGKLFEYLGARRPILSVGAEPGVAGALVESTGAGRSAGTVADVVARLREIDAAFRAGRDPWAAPEERIVEHSHLAMVAAFARELDRLVTSAPHA